MPEPKAPWVETVSGRRVSLVEPDPESISIEDIAFQLAKLPRWGGATRCNYSVADHSLRVSARCNTGPACIYKRAYQLWGLLHDAHEIYLGGDLLRSLKEVPGIREVLAPVVKGLDDAIWDRLVWPFFGEVVDRKCDEGTRLSPAYFRKQVEEVVRSHDRELGYDERCGLLSPMPWPVAGGERPKRPTEALTVACTIRTAGDAERQFLERWTELVYG